ncbi:MAG TPA: DUF1761 domain-containing protein [Candidatus Saccharimonadales bacterium]|nr:DUF1761 domain-containing protein [Candidatus Saccharimonadales bacterium]
MPSVDINWWAVIVAALINMAVGAVWYSPGVFGKHWARLTGHKTEGNMSMANTGYVVSALGALVQAWVLVHFVRFAGSTTFSKGLVTGFFIWLGFVAVVMAAMNAFEDRKWDLVRLNAGYWLVVLLINGGLLAAWR